MPARNYRVTLYNKTDVPLNLREQHLCFGDWTPGGWTPPAKIEPGSSGAWQSESGGAFSGTEGWVKYTSDDVLHPERNSQVYVHWQVPYIGSPTIPGVDRSSSQVSLGDVLPHCDAGETSGGSTFGSGDVPFNVRIAYVSHDDNSQPSLGAILTAYSNPISTLAAFGLGIESHLFVTLELIVKKSVRSALPLGYDGARGLHALAVLAKTPSVRKFLGM